MGQRLLSPAPRGLNPEQDAAREDGLRGRAASAPGIQPGNGGLGMSKGDMMDLIQQRKMSPRRGASPVHGPVTPNQGFLKPAFGRSPYAHEDQFSTMSTISAGAQSSEMSAKVQRGPRSNPIGHRSPGSPDFSPRSWDASPRTPNMTARSSSPTRGVTPRNNGIGEVLDFLDPPTAGQRTAPANNPTAWSMGIGHHGRVQLNPDNGKRTLECFNGGGPSQLHGGCILQAEESFLGPGMAVPVSARAMTEVGPMHMSGHFIKECMRGPTPRSVDAAPSNSFYTTPEDRERTDNVDMQPAGCGAWGSPEQARGKRYFLAKPDTNHVMPRHIKATPSKESQKVLTDYYKSCFGRSMRANRSEPPKPGRVARTQGWWTEEGWMNGGKLMCGGDYSRDDSQGAIVPCINSSLRRSECAVRAPRRKAEGEYSNGVSDFAKKLCIQANMQTLRMENFEHTGMGKRFNRAALSPSRGNCISPGPEQDVVAHQRGRSPSPQSPAGMTTQELKRISSPMRSTPMRSQSCSSLTTSRQMEGVLKHSGIEDARAVREHRENTERPFVDLCTAFAQIRQAALQDSKRIKDMVNPRSSQLHSLLWWPTDDNRQNGAISKGGARPNVPTSPATTSPADIMPAGLRSPRAGSLQPTMPTSPADVMPAGLRSPRSDSARPTMPTSPADVMPAGLRSPRSGCGSPRGSCPGSPTSWAAGDSPAGRRQKHFAGNFSPSFVSHDVATALKWVC